MSRLAGSLALLTLLCVQAQAGAQTTGSVVGRVLDAQSKAPLAGVTLQLLQLPHSSISAADGRFVIGAVPPGERSLRAELIGYQPVVVERVPVRAARSVEVTIELTPSAVSVPGVVVQAQRARLIEPEVSATHEV